MVDENSALPIDLVFIVARLNADWEGDIRAYDEGHVHMLMFADMLTTGIARQFPSKVGK